MADEKLPKPDGGMPGASGSSPVPSYAQDAVYAGAPPPARAEAIAAGAPTASVSPPRSDAIKAGSPTVAGTPVPSDKTPGKEVTGPHRSDINLFFCWLAGVFILLPCWAGGLSFVFYFATRRLHLHFVPELAAGWIGFILSFVLLFLLERNLWLSRFMGLRLGPHSTQLTETLYFFITGIAGLLLRSSDQPAPAAAKPQENDGTREIVETVVFVIVLVLLLKTFLVEAFVIPTGSMADTLLGYHKEYTCDKCKYRFVVNCSTEAEPQKDQMPHMIVGGVCPNCGFRHIDPNARR